MSASALRDRAAALDAADPLRHCRDLYLPSAGLAKRFEELYWSDRMHDAPIRLPAGAAALRVVQRLRDEAHRFANAFHRKARGKAMLGSALDDIPGIGPARRKALLRRFGSVRGVAAASEADIAATAGIGESLAQAIATALAALRTQT